MDDLHKTFEQLEAAWLRALKEKDTKSLEQLLSDEFVSTSWASSGELTTRKEYLHAAARTDFRRCSVDEIFVQDLDRVIVVKCRLRCECSLHGGSGVSEFLITDVWVKRAGRWEAASRHASAPIHILERTLLPAMRGTREIAWQ